MFSKISKYRDILSINFKVRIDSVKKTHHVINWWKQKRQGYTYVLKLLDRLCKLENK